MLHCMLVPLPSIAPRTLHQKTQKGLTKIKEEIRNLRKDLKRAVGSARVETKRAIYSALMIQKKLKKENREELLAQERWANIRLLRRNPKKLAQKVWGGNLSSTVPLQTPQSFLLTSSRPLHLLTWMWAPSIHPFHRTSPLHQRF